jgi:N-dimethylarginine dimethylaminohydrolase
MHNSILNRTVLMSGTSFFSVKELNSYSDASNQPDPRKAAEEFASIKLSLEQAGVKVIKVAEPAGCQDGIFTANWGLCRGNKVVLSSLPPQRQAEEKWAEKYLQDLGKEIVHAPYRFSGQGDALPCGNLLFMGSNYRTDSRMRKFIAETLGYEVIGLQTVPELDSLGRPVTNHVTGWPDSFFYDIDLALSVLTPNLIAWCPEAFVPESQDKIHALSLDKIEVSLGEARQGFACNLVSTGSTVIMSAHAPGLKAAIESKGLKVVTPKITELAKGGGYIRCTTLTLDNE